VQLTFSFFILLFKSLSNYNSFTSRCQQHLGIFLKIVNKLLKNMNKLLMSVLFLFSIFPLVEQFMGRRNIYYYLSIEKATEILYNVTILIYERMKDHEF